MKLYCNNCKTNTVPYLDRGQMFCETCSSYLMDQNKKCLKCGKERFWVRYRRFTIELPDKIVEDDEINLFCAYCDIKGHLI